MGIDVSFLMVNTQIFVRVFDDGKGMADYSIKPRSGAIGIGLGGMRQRAKDVGGICVWETTT
jgi:signal transduction histidine kinase